MFILSIIALLGYRGAQCGWLLVSDPVNNERQTQCLCIYLPRRGIIEVIYFYYNYLTLPYEIMALNTICLEIFTVTFISRDEEFAKIRSRIKLNATFNNTSHILFTQKLKSRKHFRCKNFQTDKFPDIWYVIRID